MKKLNNGYNIINHRVNPVGLDGMVQSKYLSKMAEFNLSIQKKERKKDDKLDEKIEIGDLVYLNQLYDKTIGLEKRASINKQRTELLLSNNFSRTNKFKTKKCNSKDKDKYSFFHNFSQKNIKKIKSISISPKDNNSIKIKNNKRS